MLNKLIASWCLICATSLIALGQATAPGITSQPAESGLKTADSQPDPRAPVPDGVAQSRAVKMVDDLLHDDLAAAHTPDEKIKLAKKLLQIGIDSQSDRAGQYVTWTMARDLAADAGNVSVAMDSAGHLADTYSVDRLTAAFDALKKLNKTATESTERKLLLARTDDVIDSAITAERFDIARQATELASQLATRMGDPALIADAKSRGMEARELEAASADADKARLVTQKEPANPQANLTVGIFLCFVKANWDAGLPMLALGDDVTLKALAQKELATTKDPRTLLELGDGWWDLCEKLHGMKQRNVRARALASYRGASPGLTGLAKLKADKRASEIEALTSPASTTAVAASPGAPQAPASPVASLAPAGPAASAGPAVRTADRAKEINIAIAKHNFVEGMTFAEACRSALSRPEVKSSNENTKVYRWAIKGDKHRTTSFIDALGHRQTRDVAEYGVLGYVEATFVDGSLTTYIKLDENGFRVQ